MKVILPILPLLISFSDFGQCPFDATISASSVCLGTTLTAKTAQPLSTIVWYNGYTIDSTARATQTTIFAATTVAGGNGRGSDPDQVSTPGAIFVDPAGNLYVSDADNNRVQKWAPGATSGITVAGGNGQGSGASQLYSPEGIFVDKTGAIYIADEENNRVQKWLPGATSGITVAGGNGRGSNANQLGLPTGIFVDPAGNIYVSDADNNRVQKWAPGATSGITVAGGNGWGSNANQLISPEGIWVDQGGDLYVADVDNNRIQKWAPGANAGITVAGGHGIGNNANQLCGPTAIYIDNDGNIYVADDVNDRIQLWPPGAASGTTVVGGNGSGSAPYQISNSPAVFLDQNGNIYFSDVKSHRVQKWGKHQIISIGYTYTPVTPGSYTAVITDNAGCTVTTNALVIEPVIAPTLSINGPETAVCSGNPVTYTATLSYTDATSSLTWLINGATAGDNSPVFTSDLLQPGDTISCQADFHAVCTPTATASVPVLIQPSPAVENQTYSIIYGQHQTLTPSIQGDITSWSWSPATGLSDTTIGTPIVTLLSDINYTLKVTAADGCSDTGLIIVKVNYPIGIPNAFSPNGDGKNDILYIKGGSGGALIHSFTVFNRWGAKVFQVENVPADDPNYGWKGTINGQPAPTGVYVYSITLTIPGRSEENIRGTVVLVR